MIEKTICLYDEDAYRVDFEGKVLACTQVEKEGATYYEVVLDQTVFFPEQGGQSPDKGALGGQQVLDVQIREDVIYHSLPEAVEVGTTVTGQIDWNHRFSNMQQHSGEHIFSGLVNSLYGYNNVGFHLSDQIVTMDFDGKLSEKEVLDLEYRVNEAIARNVSITVRFPKKEELASITYRSKIEIEGQVRLVEVEGYDLCACCAPHVRHTGEIGQLKVMSLQSYKGGVRISILCGFRALMAAREKAKVISDLMEVFTCGQEMLLDQVKKQQGQIQTLKGKLNETAFALMQSRLEKIPAEQKNVICFEADGDMNTIRRVLNQLTEVHEGVCGIFVGRDGAYNYIVGSKTVDCKEIATLLREKLAAKGGGSNVMIQGSVAASRQEIESVLAVYE